MEVMNICVTVNSKYMKYLYTMLLSLYENHKKGRICLYVIQCDFSDEDKCFITELSEHYQNKVEYIQADEKKFKNIGMQCDEHYSSVIYFRLLIPELIPKNVFRILLLDVDIIVNHNLKELYFMDFEGKCLAAAPNMCANCVVVKPSRKWYTQTRKNWTHYNTGILLWNLKKIREDYPENYLLQKAFQYKIEYPTFEEEVFNVEFGEDNILTIDPYVWNYIPSYEDNFSMPNFEKYLSQELLKKKCAVVHYAGVKPWELEGEMKSFSLWWEYAKKTPFYHVFLEEPLKRYLGEYIDEYRKKEAENQWQRDLDMQNLMIKFKGTKELKKYLDADTSDIYIWGAGKMGERLYGLFESVGLQGKIKGVIDEKTRGNFHGLKIQKYKEAEGMLGNKSKIIVTPLKDQYRIEWEINNVLKDNIEGVALLTYLSMLNQSYEDCGSVLE